MTAIAASAKSRRLNAGRTRPGSNKRIIRNAGAAISTLNNASMQNDSREGAFLFIQLALEAVIFIHLAICPVQQNPRAALLRASQQELPDLDARGSIVAEPAPA
jgi:hypothetical protein